MDAGGITSSLLKTEKLVGGMGQRLGKKFPGLFCTYAMRYGDPSIANVVRNLHLEKGFQKILLVPLNPQYSATTTGSVMDALCDVLKTMRSQPEIRMVRDFHNEDAYIEALAKSISDFWKKHSPLGEKGKLVLSFHGMPQSYVNKGDPYQDQTVVESDLIANRLNLKSDQWIRTYQSRFGKDVWLQPYTEPTLVELAKKGTERIDIVCPSFITDCWKLMRKSREKQEKPSWTRAVKNLITSRASMPKITGLTYSAIFLVNI